MRPHSRLRPLLVIGFALGFAAWALARFAMPSQAPIARLIDNVGKKVRANPKDAQARFLLARLYSLRYAGQSDQVPVYDPDKNPTLPSFVRIQTEGPAKRTPASAESLRLSLAHYAKAVELDPHNGFAWLGYGWMQEQAGKWVSGPKTPCEADTALRVRSARQWFDAARRTYQRVLDVSRSDDEAKEHLFKGLEAMASLEAAQNLLSLHASGKSRLDEATVSDLKALVHRLESKPTMMTPIVFPLNAGTPYASIDNPKAKVSFDLDGSGFRKRWTWIHPTAAFLCWNPLGEGRVDSGRDLFGNTTFWMFFRNGYEALSSLDDNGDGKLTGSELRFIAVWHDRNTNGVSDPGEVKPLSEYGIKGIRTVAQGRVGSVWFHPRGLIRRDGSTLPTYDWVASRR